MDDELAATAKATSAAPTLLPDRPLVLPNRDRGEGGEGLVTSSTGFPAKPAPVSGESSRGTDGLGDWGRAAGVGGWVGGWVGG